MSIFKKNWNRKMLVVDVKCGKTGEVVISLFVFFYVSLECDILKIFPF